MENNSPCETAPEGSTLDRIMLELLDHELTSTGFKLTPTPTTAFSKLEFWGVLPF